MSDKDDLWTADDIRKNATNWSLHCDGKLLEYMKNLSQTIQERGNRTNFNLHNSMLQLDRTKIALENATNQLMALQHKQFVENRVYDDDETLANVDNVPTQQLDEEPEIAPTEAIREFVKSGVELMHQYFDKITIELSDSEDDGEEVQKNVVYKLKDRYKHRPLPYIIGSKEWHEKWHIGLAEDEIDESDNEEDEEDDDVSLSSSPAISVSSNVPVSLSESENPTGGIPSRKSDGQDLFQSSSEENISKMAMPHDITDNHSTFRRQSQDTPKTVPIAKQIETRDTNTSNTIFRQQKQPQITHVIPTLIDSDPPDLDDVASMRTPQKPLNLFLDDDDDDQDDFMFDKTTKAKKQADAKRAIVTDQINVPSTSKITSINLFADDDGDIDSFLPSTSKSTAKTAPKKPEIKNLFDDDDDDDELFLQPPEPTKKTIPRATILSNTPAKPDLFQHNIFDDMPPEDDFDNLPSTSKASINPIPITSPTKKTSNLLKVNLFDDDDDDDDIFEKLISASSSSKKNSIKDESKNEIAVESSSSLVQKAEGTKDRPIVESRSKTNLFDPGRLFDDTPPSDDEQLFSGMSSKKAASKPKPVESSKQNTGEFYNDFSETVTSMPSDSIGDVVAEIVTPTESTKSTSVIEKPKIATADAISTNIKDIESKELLSEVKPTSKKRSEFLKKIDTFSSANVNEQKSETAPIPKARPPKKLNIGNIDINVAALLPGAKRAKSVEKSDIKESSDDISNDDESPLSPAKTVPTTARTMSQDNVDSSGRLANLNRNRAKNLSRRPSTRAGRKQQYQRSIESEEQIDGPSSQIEQTKSKSSPIRETTPVKELKQNVEEMDDKSDIPPSPTKSPLNTRSPLSKNIFEDDSFETTKESSKPTEKAEETEVVNEITNESDQLESEGVQSIDESVEKENPFSFLEDEQADEIDDFMIKPKTPPPTTTSVTVKATPAYIDELPPELDSIDDPPFSKDTKGNSSLSQNALSLFGDDDDDDDDGDDDDFDNDEMFARSDTTKTKHQPELPSNTSKPDDDWSYSSSFVHEMPPASNEKKLPISSALSLFDDNDDDLDNDDDIFGIKPSTEHKSEPEQQKHPTDVAQPARSSVQEPSPVLSDTKLPGSSVLGLFDDDPDDNDLFDTIKPTELKSEQIAQKQPPHDSPPSTSNTQPVKLPVSSAAGLFEDNLDNNDIFDTKDSKESKNDEEEEKTISTIESIKDRKPPQSVSMASKTSKISLFGDDDDDDDDGDLFGRPPPLPEPVKQLQSKKAESKRIVGTVAFVSDDSSDDDLLFGGGGGKITKKNPPKSSSSTTSTTKTAPKTVKQINSSEKLFSDSEDDGDLFGSKSKPSQESSKKFASTQSTSKATKEDSSRSVKTLSPSAIDNDPLADLLK